jgi:hydrogenase maturation protein HypF
LRRLGGIADYFLVHDRDIYSRYDDSVMLVEGDSPRFTRRAWVLPRIPYTSQIQPFRARLRGRGKKNTFCLTCDEYAFVSQHIGDMENWKRWSTLLILWNCIKNYSK